jgi:Ca2+-binding RTX toxin-like protein
VEFLNDAYGGTATTDRNLHVESATYNGVAVPNSALHLLSAGTQSFSFTELASPPTGPQTIAGTEGPDTLTGTSRPDSLSGLGGNDVLRGGGSSDTLLGGDGNDRILGGYGDDVITLGAGRDVAIFNGSVGNRRTTHDGADRITDFVSGVDKLDIRSVASAADIAAKVVTGGIEVALATGGKVLLQGLTSLRAGDVTLNGKALPLAVGPSTPAPVLPTTTATVTGTAGADTLAGGTNADLLLGAAGNDTLSAGGSDDVLRGGVGADRLTGGAGKDVFVMARGDGQDWIVDFTPGQDRLWLEGITAAQVTQVAETRSGTSGMTVSLGSGDEFFLARVTAKLPASDIVFA